jgi:hypothetical protein
MVRDCVYIYDNDKLIGAIPITIQTDNYLDLINSSSAYLEQKPTVQKLIEYIKLQLKNSRLYKYKYELKRTTETKTFLDKLSCFKYNLIVTSTLVKE